jgi:hypothetical protein
VWEACTFVYGWLFRHWNTRTGVKLGAVLPLLLARKQVSVTRSAPLGAPATSLTRQLSMDHAIQYGDEKVANRDIKVLLPLDDGSTYIKLASSVSASGGPSNSTSCEQLMSVRVRAVSCELVANRAVRYYPQRDNRNEQWRARTRSCTRALSGSPSRRLTPCCRGRPRSSTTVARSSSVGRSAAATCARCWWRRR